MKLLLFIGCLAFCLLFLARAKETRKLYEEDLLLTKRRYWELKTGFHGKKRGFSPGELWPKGEIPYVLDDSLKFRTKAVFTIFSAMEEWATKSCVKFVPRERQRAYLIITNNDKKICASTDVGYTGGRYFLLLASRCWWKGMVIHELGHVLGMLHEHTRPDRDEYVTVEWENIKDGRGFDFTRQNDSDVSSYITPYDYSSIMHYGDAFASKNDEKTLVPKDSEATIGHWEQLSDIDIQQINLHYNCPADAYKFEKFICQDQKDNLACYGGRKIQITEAYYGRKKFFKCGTGLTNSCEAGGSKEKIMDACDGKDSCELTASNSIYGNPCPVYASKYIFVMYTCAPSS